MSALGGTTLNSRRVHAGRVFDLHVASVELATGVTFEMEVIRHPGAAAIVALSEIGQVLLLRQYRHSVETVLWEIPAGTRDAGEAPLSCARRELEEETGFAASRWEPMGELLPVPGYADERIHLFLASGLTASRQCLDRDEQITVHALDFEEALHLIDTGEIYDGKTVAALLKADRLRRRS
ncbi:MAG: NUDIX hydrolase [Pseudomonadota bacterium]